MPDPQERYLDLLYAANERMNLTRIPRAEAPRKHVDDALTLEPYLVALEATRVVDIGAGGGVPGLPLAIALPDVAFTLLESTAKKARFLKDAAEALGLANVHVCAERAEAVARLGAPLRAHFDVAVARAVGPLRVLVELAMPLVREHGVLLAIKGERAADEIDAAEAALDALHAAVVDVTRTETGTIVVVEKERATPRGFPRPPGAAKSSPL